MTEELRNLSSHEKKIFWCNPKLSHLRTLVYLAKGRACLKSNRLTGKDGEHETEFRRRALLDGSRVREGSLDCFIAYNDH